MRNSKCWYILYDCGLRAILSEKWQECWVCHKDASAKLCVWPNRDIGQPHERNFAVMVALVCAAGKGRDLEMRVSNPPTVTYISIVVWDGTPIGWVVSEQLCVLIARIVNLCSSVIVRRAGLLWSQQDFERRWSVPLFKCLTVLEFSFILFDLCLLITFFNFIMNYVPIVTFWIFTYHKIWILSIMFCFIWSYWIIYFLACLEVSWRVVS